MGKVIQGNFKKDKPILERPESRGIQEDKEELAIRKKMGRICATPACGTKLSIANSSDRCFRCQNAEHKI